MHSLKRPWINLALAPLWFLVVIACFSAYFISSGIQETELPIKITEYTPTIILLVQLLLLLTLWVTSRKEGFNLFKDGWTRRDYSSGDIFLGIVTGAIIAGLYLFILSDLQAWMQVNIGDYVPAGETMTALGKQAIPFFIANVVLAPFVEESLYRNYALTRFSKRYGITSGILITSVMFGLLHWVGGFWYILMTIIFVGIPFAIIASKRGNMIWVFAAHLTLNLLEFIYILGLKAT